MYTLRLLFNRPTTCGYRIHSLAKWFSIKRSLITIYHIKKNFSIYVSCVPFWHRKYMSLCTVRIFKNYILHYLDRKINPIQYESINITCWMKMNVTFPLSESILGKSWSRNKIKIKCDSWILLLALKESLFHDKVAPGSFYSNSGLSPL